MSVFKLADDHPLTQAGLRCLYLVEAAESGLRIGDVVFEFPFGRIIDTGMACRRYGILPLGVDLMEQTSSLSGGPIRLHRGFRHGNDRRLPRLLALPVGAPP